MTWNDTKAELIGQFATLWHDGEYRFVKSRSAFERDSPDDMRALCVVLAGSNTGNHWLSLQCSVRNRAIDEVFRRTAGAGKINKQGCATIYRSAFNAPAIINTQDDIGAAMKKSKHFIDSIAKPFLHRDYSLQDYSDLLNSDFDDIHCENHSNPPPRCFVGLIAAKLSSDPLYDQIKSAYLDRLRTLSNGFYFPSFVQLIDELNE